MMESLQQYHFNLFAFCMLFICLIHYFYESY
uniref:Uncharacterized protein n=1 Tax=Anguilla anguilla TaxID=7936 RepID=A0A0E9R7U1_ANGAN